MSRFVVILGCLMVLAGPVWALDGAALEAWQADLALLLKEFPEREKSLTPETRAAFLEHVEALQARLPESNELQVIAGVMQAVAIAGNAHTRALPNLPDERFGRVPIRLHWFSDGVYVVKARPDHADLLRGRLVHIGGHSADELLAGLGTTFYGNASWRRYVGASMMAIPALLYGLDLIGEPDTFAIAIETPDGVLIERTLKAEQSGHGDPGEAWWNLAPAKQLDDPNWVYAFDPEETPAPLYLKNPNAAFWVEYIEASKTLYVQYNTSVAQPGVSPRDNRTLVLDSLESHDVEHMIVDLRFNAGGNLMLMRNVFGQVLEEAPFKRADSLYVITSRSTFSAGLFHAANLKQNGNAVIVGELAGDDLDFWAEGRAGFSLPNSNMQIRAQNGFHSYSKVDRPEFAEYLYLDLSIDTLEPDIPAPMTFDDYISGRDPALTAVLAAIGN